MSLLPLIDGEEISTVLGWSYSKCIEKMTHTRDSLRLQCSTTFSPIWTTWLGRPWSFSGTLQLSSIIIKELAQAEWKWIWVSTVWLEYRFLSNPHVTINFANCLRSIDWDDGNKEVNWYSFSTVRCGICCYTLRTNKTDYPTIPKWVAELNIFKSEMWINLVIPKDMFSTTS